MKRICLLLVFTVLSVRCLGDSTDRKIIITTPGYTSIYRYSTEDFAENLASEFKIESASAREEVSEDGRAMVRLWISQKEYLFTISPEAPLVRLSYDRNRRQFKGVGFNYIDHAGSKYDAPIFKGTTLTKLPALWQPQIEKLIADKSFLEEGVANVFILEADIDEDGIVHKIVELNGALKQYSQVFIDKIYDLAVRGWDPAKRDGVPFRTVVQLRFEVMRD